MWENTKIYLSTIPRKAWWLIGWAALYAAVALGYLYYEISNDIFFTEKSRFSSVLMLVQMVWVVISALPLIPNTHLNSWVFNWSARPFFIIKERDTNHFVKVMATHPLFTEDFNLAQRFWDLKEAKSHRAYLESRRASLHDEYEIKTIFRVKAKK